MPPLFCPTLFADAAEGGRLPHFPSPHEVGRRCPGGADEGLFLREARWQTRRRCAVVQSSCASRSAPHPPLRGTFSPSKAGEKGKWGVREQGAKGAHSFSRKGRMRGPFSGKQDGRRGDVALTCKAAAQPKSSRPPSSDGWLFGGGAAVGLAGHRKDGAPAVLQADGRAPGADLSAVSPNSLRRQPFMAGTLRSSPAAIASISLLEATRRGAMPWASQTTLSANLRMSAMTAVPSGSGRWSSATGGSLADGCQALANGSDQPFARREAA